MKPTVLVLLFIFATATLLAQKPKKSTIAAKIEKFKALLDQSGNSTPEMTDSLDINNKINTQLTEILLASEIKKYDLDKVFKDTNLSVTHSKDKRLWLFTWYENTGGSFKSNISIIQGITKTNKVIVADAVINEDIQDAQAFNSASFEQIIKLPSKNKNLYLCMGYVIGCGSCSAQVATVIELKANSINLEYPAFEFRRINDLTKEEVTGNSPAFMIDSRVDDIKTFEYDAKTQSIRYKYIPDDNTPITVDDEKYDANAKPIVGYLKWNGSKFTETIIGHKSTD